jgi:helix-turn-helix protein
MFEFTPNLHMRHTFTHFISLHKSFQNKGVDRMLKKIENTLAILLAVCFVLSVTTAAVSADQNHVEVQGGNQTITDEGNQNFLHSNNQNPVHQNNQNFADANKQNIVYVAKQNDNQININNNRDIERKKWEMTGKTGKTKSKSGTVKSYNGITMLLTQIT